MKKIIFLLAFMLLSGGVAHAGLLKTNLDGSVKTDVGVGVGQRATSSAAVNANVNSNVYGNVERGNATSSANSNADGSATLGVSLDAKAIRGWSEGEKSDFLLTVKNHAQLQSGQDLENFAKGVMAADAHVDAVVTDDSHVKVSYKMPAKFLGMFQTEIDAMANVSFDTDKPGNGPKEVTVRFPWYRMFYNLDSEVKADILENAVEASIQSDANTAGSTTSANVSARNGRTVQLISNTLKNIRANAEATAEAEASMK
ncbi:hypothetical protein EPO17_03500 [Patescibacteria group bacterium]|nr:MAG: hypothetical protein EPO17_03500 [Patescibacteria group bacterium]